MEQMIAAEIVDDFWLIEYRRYQDLDCETFRSDLLEEMKSPSETEGNDDTRRRNLLGEQQNVVASYPPRRRRLKSGTKAAVSSAVLEEGEASQQMELEAMIGPFFIHFALMALSILIGMCKKVYERFIPLRSNENMKLDTSIVAGMMLHTFETDHSGTFDTVRSHSFGFSNIMKGRLNEDLEVVSRDDGVVTDGMLADGSLQSQQVEELKYSFERSEATIQRKMDMMIQENHNLQDKVDMMVQENQDMQAAKNVDTATQDGQNQSDTCTGHSTCNRILHINLQRLMLYGWR